MHGDLSLPSNRAAAATAGRAEPRDPVSPAAARTHAAVSHGPVIDGVFAPTSTGGAVFHPATAIDPLAIATVQASVRRRLMQSFVRRGLLAQEDAQAMAQWAHSGGCSVDGSVRIEAADRAGRERLLRYCARPDQGKALRRRSFARCNCAGQRSTT